MTPSPSPSAAWRLVLAPFLVLGGGLALAAAWAVARSWVGRGGG